MRAFVPDYELRVPKTLKDALSLLKDPSYKAFAGGTDLMVLFEAGVLPAGKYVSLAHLKELKGIRSDAKSLTIGALTTYTEIREHGIIQKEFPALSEAARETGAVAIQNRGTLGGNIANASPAADSPPALLVYGAELDLISESGKRTVTYDAFHSGYKKTALQTGEIISAIRLPRGAKGRKHYYRKVGTRKAQAISKVVLAAVAKKKGKELLEVRLALGSVAPTPLRAVKTEHFLAGQTVNPDVVKKAQDLLAKEIAPIDDIRSNAVFRRKVAENLLGEFLGSL